MKTNAPASLRLMLPYLRPYLPQAAGAAGALVLSSALVLAIGQGLRHLIDSGFSSHRAAALNTAALVMFGVVAALAAATSVRFALISWLGERCGADLRRDLFNHTLTLSPGYFETARTGDILSRLTADIAILQTLIGSSLSMWLRSSLTAFGSLALLVATSPKLAAIIVLVVPLVLGPALYFGRKERRLSRTAQDRVGDLGAFAEETLRALPLVQAFTHEPEDRARFATAIEASVNAATRRIRTRALLILTIILLGFGAITFSLWVGGRDVIEGRLSAGDLAAFIFYAVILAGAGATLSEIWGELQRAAGAADRIAEIFEETPQIAAPAHPLPFPPGSGGAIAFENVGFAYPSRPDTPALRDVSFTIRPGETVALVGPSGAGKTTIFQLLLRFQDVTSGAVRVDGVDVRAADPAALRRRMALVPQDSVLFSASALDNIRFARPNASDADIRAACEAAAADFLFALPDGLTTFLGEKGVRLSGGQRQRVAIARAILRRAPILLLDEATSALDAESEQAVQHALAVLSHDCTTLVVAHRLATIRRADRILVLDHGAVVAMGSHDALVAEGGLYSRLAALQFTSAEAAPT
jgi:ATP-binding cassette subfamily B protein